LEHEDEVGGNRKRSNRKEQEDDKDVNVKMRSAGTGRDQIERTRKMSGHKYTVVMWEKTKRSPKQEQEGKTRRNRKSYKGRNRKFRVKAVCSIFCTTIQIIESMLINKDRLSRVGQG
jgi:hypothetical protein